MPADENEVAELTALMGDRPRWLAASTHAGEEEVVGRVHRSLAPRHPNLLSLVVPRHPERGPAIAEQLRESGMRVALRSAGEALTPETEIYVADTLGELGLFYRISGIAFVGRSLVPMGGQNPLEPARLDCAVAFGPHTFNFADMVRRMIAAGAATAVADETALATTVARWLESPSDRSKAAEAARTFAEAEAGVLDKVMDDLKGYLDDLAEVVGAP